MLTQRRIIRIKRKIVPQLVEQYNDLIQQQLVNENNDDCADDNVCIDSEIKANPIECNHYNGSNNSNNENKNLSQLTNKDERNFIEKNVTEEVKSNVEECHTSHNNDKYKEVISFKDKRLRELQDKINSDKSFIDCGKTTNDELKFGSDSNVKTDETKKSKEKESEEYVEIVLNPILQTLLFNRNHHFVIKTIIPKEMCDICGQSFNFSDKYSHCIDCLSITHMNCKEKIPLPCIPYTIPNKYKTKSSKEISDYVYPAFKPSIPLILIRCCHEIEVRCQVNRSDDLYLMNSEGLKQVKDLCDKIMKMKNNILLLEDYNINFICGVVKKFLNDLNEPLTGKEMWKQFSFNSRKKDDEEIKTLIKQLVNDLKTTNKDTLAFMILHLQNMASKQKYLTLQNLAEIFCPIICGDTEVARKLKLMIAMLEIDCEYWLSTVFKQHF